jgi:hypothetical protein
MRPGAALSIATWGAASKNILSYAISVAVGEWLPAPVNAAIQRLEHFAMPGRRERWLSHAGLSEVDSELWSWPGEFPDEAAMWELATGPAMLGAVLKDVDDDILASARVRFGDLLSDYRRSDGSFALPYAFDGGRRTGGQATTMTVLPSSLPLLASWWTAGSSSSGRRSAICSLSRPLSTRETMSARWEASGPTHTPAVRTERASSAGTGPAELTTMPPSAT